MRLARFDDHPLKKLHAHIRTELEKHTFVGETEPSFPKRGRALGFVGGEAPVAADPDQAVRTVVIDAWYEGGPVSLLLTSTTATLEFGSGERVASRSRTVEAILGELFGLAAKVLPTLEPAEDTALPEASCARIWIRTVTGLFVAEGRVEQWSKDEHDGALLYRRGVGVMGVLLEGDG